jgi:hypothetical protein
VSVVVVLGDIPHNLIMTFNQYTHPSTNESPTPARPSTERTHVRSFASSPLPQCGREKTALRLGFRRQSCTQVQGIVKFGLYCEHHALHPSKYCITLHCIAVLSRPVLVRPSSPSPLQKSCGKSKKTNVSKIGTLGREYMHLMAQYGVAGQCGAVRPASTKAARMTKCEGACVNCVEPGAYFTKIFERVT